MERQWKDIEDSTMERPWKFGDIDHATYEALLAGVRRHPPGLSLAVRLHDGAVDCIDCIRVFLLVLGQLFHQFGLDLQDFTPFGPDQHFPVLDRHRLHRRVVRRSQQRFGGGGSGGGGGGVLARSVSWSKR